MFDDGMRKMKTAALALPESASKRLEARTTTRTPEW